MTLFQRLRICWLLLTGQYHADNWPEHWGFPITFFLKCPADSKNRVRVQILRNWQDGFENYPNARLAVDWVCDDLGCNREKAHQKLVDGYRPRIWREDAAVMP